MRSASRSDPMTIRNLTMTELKPSNLRSPTSPPSLRLLLPLRFLCRTQDMETRPAELRRLDASSRSNAPGGSCGISSAPFRTKTSSIADLSTIVRRDIVLTNRSCLLGRSNVMRLMPTSFNSAMTWVACLSHIFPTNPCCREQ